jgi:hypothetical protein
VDPKVLWFLLRTFRLKPFRSSGLPSSLDYRREPNLPAERAKSPGQRAKSPGRESQISLPECQISRPESLISRPESQISRPESQISRPRDPNLPAREPNLPAERAKSPSQRAKSPGQRAKSPGQRAKSPGRSYFNQKARDITRFSKWPILWTLGCELQIRVLRMFCNHSPLSWLRNFVCLFLYFPKHKKV